MGTGRLQLDLLEATASINGQPVEFGMAEELRLWLRGRSDQDGLGWQSLSRAALRVDFDCREVPGRKAGVLIRELHFKCTAELEAAAQEAVATLESREVGIKEGDGPWVVH
jgi:hypothetical protein